MKKRKSDLHYASHRHRGSNRSKRRLKECLNPDVQETPSINEEAAVSEEELEREAAARERAVYRKQRRQKIWFRIRCALLLLGCIYLVFLIYGLAITSYGYDDSGQVRPRIVRIQQLREKRAYEEILGYYLRARTLYEQVLSLDYRLGEGLEEEMLLGTEYESMLDQVAKLSVDLEAATTDSRYGQLQKMLLAWIKDDIAVYLQNMAAAISQNNQEKSDHALTDRKRVYQDFAIITENIVVLGHQIANIDISNLYEWSPERYVSEVLEGIPYGE